jgi:hypothetical protein
MQMQQFTFDNPGPANARLPDSTPGKEEIEYADLRLMLIVLGDSWHKFHAVIKPAWLMMK